MFSSRTDRSVDSCVHGSSGHMVFQSSVVFFVICHCLTCLAHPPFMFFLGFKVHVVPQLWLFMYLQLYIVVSVSCQPFISSFCTANLLICGVDSRRQAAWLAWYDSQLCLRSTFSCIKCQYSIQSAYGQQLLCKNKKQIKATENVLLPK